MKIHKAPFHRRGASVKSVNADAVRRKIFTASQQSISLKPRLITKTRMNGV